MRSNDRAKYSLLVFSFSNLICLNSANYEGDENSANFFLRNISAVS